MQKALQLDPNRSDAYLNLAMCRWAANSGMERRRVSRKRSTESQVHQRAAVAGNFYQTRGRFPEAEQWFREPLRRQRTIRAQALLPACTWPRTSPAKPRSSCASRRRIPQYSVGYRMLGDFYFANKPARLKPRTSMPCCIGTCQGHGGQEELHSTADPERPA